MTILGRNLFPYDGVSSLTDPMLVSSGCSVTLNGDPLPLIFAGASKVNAQIPFSFAGLGNLTVTTANGSAQMGIQVGEVAPQFLTTAESSRFAVASHPDGSIVNERAPVNPGETVTLMLTGLGAVDGAPHAGTLPSGNHRVRADVRVMFGAIAVTPESAALSQSAPGVYEIRVRIPHGFNSANTPLQVLANGTTSNIAYLPHRS